MTFYYTSDTYIYKIKGIQIKRIIFNLSRDLILRNLAEGFTNLLN